uniref:Uncharacterized protein n=1 Tax=Cacopsylla melanoneura TaxID=428564 RepID=A0A8D9E1E1_9HEMI
MIMNCFRVRILAILFMRNPLKRTVLKVKIPSVSLVKRLKNPTRIMICLQIIFLIQIIFLMRNYMQEIVSIRLTITLVFSTKSQENRILLVSRQRTTMKIMRTPLNVKTRVTLSKKRLNCLIIVIY